ncbi:unnamed protein product [Nezara viridula]|uniref:Cyclic nucleotide-binding domain-containing protein n=1 Tax=Nezara viridula TaxID=85310 RepID=A0A9P0H683_NEZVI|nr:unnamed protein product [Nezara viridula]
MAPSRTITANRLVSEQEVNTRVSAEEERQLMASMSKEWTPEPEGGNSKAIVEPQSCLYVTWLSVVTLSYLYNCFVIPLRTTFPYQSTENTPTWLALDLSMDFIYLLDMAVVKPRVMFLEGGFWVRDTKLTRGNYLGKSEFIADVLSLTPLDLLYFYFGPNYPLLRVPRLLKIRDIIATATRSQTEYRKLMDETLHHLRKLNLPQKQIERVKTWFSYTWEQQHTLDESRVLDNLPHKMKTDVAINVHISTLNKVQLFKDCDEALLRELVLKLRPVLYLPGDYICRKGEVGREMYIVKSGQVQVVTGTDGIEVLATLTEGSVFGEISLLQVSGGNRRTADVRSNGFSNLFVLNKDDLNGALKFHPNAQEILRKKARQLVKQNAAREQMTKAKAEVAAEVLIGNPEPGPKQPRLLPIVMKVLPPESGSARLLKYGSRWGRKRRLNTTNSAESAPICLKQKRCSSIDLGYLGRSSNQLGKQNTENTFQCSVTVHREMSK